MKRILFYASAVAIMFSSCSKDTTEVVSLDKNLATIGASFEVDEQTRTYLGPLSGNKRAVLWSKGDALGVFSEADVDMNAVYSLTSGENTGAGVFSGSNELFGGVSADTPKDFYAYYPYAYGAKITEGKLSGLQIPATQLYSTATEDGTFSANTHPAVAITKDVKDASEPVDFELKSVAYNLVFPIRGMGNVEKLTLTIDGVALSGEGYVDLTDVDLAEYEPVLKLNGTEQSSIVVKMGTNTDTNSLNFNGTKYVVFVVPAEIDIYDKEIKLEATLKEGQGTSTQTVKIINMPAEHKAGYMKLARGMYANIYANMDYTELNKGVKEPWVFGVDGEWVIDDQLDFIVYSYFTQMYQSSTHDAEEYPFMPKESDYQTLQDNGYEMTANGIVVNNLDFSAWNAAKAEEVRNELILQRDNLEKQTQDEASTQEVAMLNVKINALEWYYKNDGAINSLGYNTLKGYAGVADGKVKPVEIANLDVKGNGLTFGANLESLVLTNIDVVADEGAEYAGLVAAVNNSEFSNGRNGDKISLTDVTVKGGTVTVKGNTIAGGVFGKMNPRYALANVTALPTISATNYGQVYGVVSISDSGVATINLDELKADLSHVAIYEVNGVTDNTTLKVTSAKADDAVNYAGVAGSVVRGSLFVEGTSYWNGNLVQSDADATTLSAEELAYAVFNRINATLTNDINLQNNVKWPVTSSNTSIVVKSNFKDDNNTIYNDWTVKNVKIVEPEAAAGKYYSVFGAKADIHHINVKGVEITLTAGTGNPNLFVSGLTLTGSVKNVDVENIDITVSKLWDTTTGLIVSTPSFMYNSNTQFKAIGGVIAQAAFNSVENVSVKGLTIDGDAYLNTTEDYTQGSTFVGANIGAIVGVSLFNNSDDTTTYKGLKVDGAVLPNAAQTAKMSKTSKNYAQDCVYSFSGTAIGSIWMYTATINASAKSTHYLVADNCSFSATAGRLAAAILMPRSFINKTDGVTGDVTISETKITGFNYMIYAEGVNHSSKSFIGFNKQ